MKAMEAKGAGDLKTEWNASPFAVIQEIAPGKLILTRAQNSGTLTVTATVSNGGKPVTQTATIAVTEPKHDAWVTRTPAKDEKGEKAELGWWGMELAKRLLESQKVPIFILNAAVGGTRIDQHQRNAAAPTDLTTIYGRMLWRVQQARLTHGIRGILWHQGESDQGSDGPTGGYGWETYQQLFVEMSGFRRWQNHASVPRGFAEVARVAQAEFGQTRQSFAVFGRAALHQAKALDELAAPAGEAVGELEFKDDAVAEGERGVPHRGGEGGRGSDFSTHRAVEGDTHIVAHGVHIGFAQVGDVCQRAGLQALGEPEEPLNGVKGLGIVAEQMFRIGQMACEQPGHGVFTDSATLLEDAVVHPTLDFKEDWRVGFVVVEAQAQLVAVFVAVDGRPKSIERAGVEIKAVDRVAEVRFADAILVQFQVREEEFVDGDGLVLIKHVFLLEALALHAVVGHRRQMGWLAAAVHFCWPAKCHKPALKASASATHTPVHARDSLTETTCVVRWNTPKSSASIARTNALNPTHNQIVSVIDQVVQATLAPARLNDL